MLSGENLQMANSKLRKTTAIDSQFTIQNSQFPPLMTSDPGSFAEATIVERKPQIIQRVLADNAYPPDIVRALEVFQTEIAFGLIAPLYECVPDVAFWNAQQRVYQDKTWREVPWYFAETYFYRRLLEAVQYFEPGPWQGHDPFASQKRAQEQTAVTQLEAVWRDIERIPPEERFVLLLHSCLWGNRADLSNFTVRESAHRGLETHRERANLLIDDTESVLTFLSNSRQGQQNLAADQNGSLTSSVKPVAHIAFINDNVGADSLFDLALTDFLLAQGWTQRVTFYLKNQPFFVSDAMPGDIHWMIAHLQTSTDAAVAALGARLKAYLDTDLLHLDTDSFWTSCYSFWYLPAALWDVLAQADIIILKGDVNYRRLLDDRRWPSTTPITIAARFPKPYLILRTLKGEIIVNLPPGQAEALAQEDPTWLINGKRGIIQAVG
ncbi:MAG: protein-glutamate O-methyltransferase family protein [Anaerolineae bacterium]|nr:protein-glutamate O-methyltransferase family protein [Anaerolineae bacterium]